MIHPTEAAEVVPLRPLVFAILLALNEQDRHGYGIMKVVNARLRRRALLGPGTLYRTLKELREASVIAYAAASEDADPRRRYYQITAQGRRVARQEASRMEAWVEAARASRLLGFEAGE